MVNQKHEIIKIVRKILQVLRQNDYRIRKAYIYGSYARGNYHRDSDIDILLISEDFTGNRFKDSIKLMRLCRKIDSRIELMPYHPKDFTDADPLVVEVKTTGKEINF